MFGFKVPLSQWAEERSVVADPELTPKGNLLLRVGRQTGPDSWEADRHVVMTPGEAEDFARRILYEIDA